MVKPYVFILPINVTLPKKSRGKACYADYTSVIIRVKYARRIVEVKATFVEVEDDTETSS